MRNAGRLSLALLVLFAVAAGSSRQSHKPTITTVIAFRHGEKADESRDPPLSSAGRARAEMLAWMLRSTTIDAAFSTDYRRTRETLEPLVNARKLTADRDTPPEQLAGRILADYAGKTVAVCGHSNTVPLLLRALGAAFEPELLEGYDDLFIVTIARAGDERSASLTRLHYPASRSAN